ncbi:hypothetical protein KC866_00725 [Patescibacteria group bacterium]|nr:hypothetical protein [Patescibacteria group bacterium]
MENTQTIQQLETLGLSREQSLVYLCLLDNGFSKAGSIPKKTGLKRGLVYKVLDQLIERGLAKKHGEDTAVARFAPLSPEGLKSLVEEKLRAAEAHQELFKDLYSPLKSKFNLLTGRPSVRYYEGHDEVREMLYDCLETTGVIYTYADADMVAEHFPDLNKEHIAERHERGIAKRILVADSKHGRQTKKDSLKDDLTDIRIIEKEYLPFSAVAEIYDNKVAYITSSDIGISGVLIEDRQIATMQKFMFEALWEQSQ